jgi:exopolysaccharide biosynthesis polyprenyl glycosylphosphotransferase
MAAALISGRHDIEAYALCALLTLPGWAVLFKAYGLYDRDLKRISHTTVDDLPGLFHALVVGGLLLWALFRVLPVHQLVFEEIATFAVGALLLMLVGRTLVRFAVRQLGQERVLLVGEGETTNVLVRKLQSHPEYGLDPVGALTPSGQEREEPGSHGLHAVAKAAPLAVLGRLEQLTDMAALHQIGRVIVSPRGLDEDELLTLLRRCKELSLKVSVLPQMFDVMGPSVEVDEVEGITVLGLNPPVLSRSSRSLKRAMDVCGAVVALLVAAPLLAGIAIAVRFDSPGPVFFRQSRTGRGGNRFRLLKFRTMVPDAEARQAELLAQSRDPHWLKLETDPRITRMGSFLRMTSLDELPQFWNVLRGDMSLVGPRPLIESEDRLVEDWGRARLDLTPGMTGLWQVLGRSSIPFEEMVKLDYLYVTNWSLWTDIRLILRTLPVVLLRRGAN